MTPSPRYGISAVALALGLKTVGDVRNLFDGLDDTEILTTRPRVEPLSEAALIARRHLIARGRAEIDTVEALASFIEENQKGLINPDPNKPHLVQDFIGFSNIRLVNRMSHPKTLARSGIVVDFEAETEWGVNPWSFRCCDFLGDLLENMLSDLGITVDPLYLTLCPPQHREGVYRAYVVNVRLFVTPTAMPSLSATLASAHANDLRQKLPVIQSMSLKDRLKRFGEILKPNHEVAVLTGTAPHTLPELAAKVFPEFGALLCSQRGEDHGITAIYGSLRKKGKMITHLGSAYEYYNGPRIDYVDGSGFFVSDDLMLLSSIDRANTLVEKGMLPSNVAIVDLVPLRT